nr:MAG TPA: major capsid protein [Caudoviricetes sp.]
MDDTKHTLTFTPPTGALVCVTFPEATKPAEGQTTYTNRATINGASLEATATIKASGGTDGDGTVKPAPTPAPTPTPTTEPTPKPTPTTEPTPKPTPTTTPTPAPTPTVDKTPKPEPKADEQPALAPVTRLAKTGATLDGIGVALVSLLIGVALVFGGRIIDRRLTK